MGRRATSVNLRPPNISVSKRARKSKLKTPLDILTYLYPNEFKWPSLLLIRPYTTFTWPARGVPFDGLMGKGNQLLVTQTVKDYT